MAGSVINKKIFGDDIDPKLKQKLELLQRLAGNQKFSDITNDNGETFSSTYAATNVDKFSPEKMVDLINLDGMYPQHIFSQRTAFARLWTALDIAKYTPTDINDVGFHDTREEVQKIIDGETGQEPITLNVDEFIGKSQSADNFGKFGVLKKNSLYEKVYTIGTHDKHTTQGFSGAELQPSEYTNDAGAISDFEKFGDSEFPDELEVNPFLKPPTGIIQISSQTEGALGGVKKTNVVFVVNNFRDFDKIYSKFFLKPGAQLFLDFGWNNSKLYNPEDLIDAAKKSQLPAPYNSQELTEILYGDEGFLSKNVGDLEIINGFVTNYDAKIRENGTIECNVEITSRNQALFENRFSGGEAVRERIAYSMDKEIMRFVMTFYAKKDALGDLSEATKNVIVNGDWSADTDTQDALEGAWEYFVQGKGGEESFSIADGEFRNTPNDQALEVGVFWAGDEPDEKNLYVTFGFFEDKILNSEFGFGDDLSQDPLEEASNLQPRFDSRNSLVVRYNHLFERQQKIGRSGITKLPLIMPPQLHPEGEYNAEDSSFLDQCKPTYNSVRGLMPSQPFQTRTKGTKEHIIPIREIFIQVDLIKDAIMESENVDEMMEYLLKKIRKKTGKVWDLQTAASYDGTNCQVVDNKYFYAEDNNKEGDGDLFYDSLFMFNPHDKMSMVKNMDMTYEMPKDGLASMVAIQNSGPGGAVIQTDELVEQALSQQALDQIDGLGTQYLPKLGDDSTKRSQTDPSAVLMNYAEGDSQFDTTFQFNDPKGDYEQFAKDAKEMKWGSVNESDEETDEDWMTRSWGNYEPDDDVAREQNVGKCQVTKDVLKYYEFLVDLDADKMKPASTIMPIKLSLTIPGFSSLCPGDLFRINYLPLRYQKRVFFQVIGISHEVSPTTWSTTIETVMRMRPETPEPMGKVTPDWVTVDKRSLDKYHKLGKQSGKSKNRMAKTMVQQLWPRVEKLRPVPALGGTEPALRDVEMYEFIGYRHGPPNSWLAPGGGNPAAPSPSSIALDRKDSVRNFDAEIHNFCSRKIRMRNKVKAITTEKKMKSASSTSVDRFCAWNIDLPKFSNTAMSIVREFWYDTRTKSNQDEEPQYLGHTYYGTQRIQSQKTVDVPTCYFATHLTANLHRNRYGAINNYKGQVVQWMGASNRSSHGDCTNSTPYSLMAKHRQYTIYGFGQYERIEGCQYWDSDGVNTTTLRQQGTGHKNNAKLTSGQVIYRPELQVYWMCGIQQGWTYRLMIYKNLFIVWPIALIDGTSTLLGGANSSYAWLLKRCYSQGFQQVKIPVRDYLGSKENSDHQFTSRYN